MRIIANPAHACTWLNILPPIASPTARMANSLIYGFILLILLFANTSQAGIRRCSCLASFRFFIRIYVHNLRFLDAFNYVVGQRALHAIL